MYIVGDCFRGYAQLKGVCTSSEFLNKNLTEHFQINPEIEEIVIGQGVSYKDRIAIVSLLATHSKSHLLHSMPTPICGERHVHKKLIDNSLITLPQPVSDNIYSSNVFISDKNELIIDHISGHHVQGMVAIEVFRQMILATTEEYFPLENQIPMSFVWKRIDTLFETYLFPIDIQVSIEVNHLPGSKKSRQSYQGNLIISQGGRVACTGITEWDTFDARILEKQERFSALSSVA